MDVASALRALTRNERAFVLASLVALILASWVYLFHLSAGMSGMSGMESMPGMAAMEPALAAWTPADALAMFAMWAVMMAAMMLPSAAPTILLHAALRARSGPGTVAHSGLFSLGYIAVWAGFSAGATALQWALERAVLLSPMMVSSSDVLGGLLLITAGAYQMSPYKNRCLSHCRSPAGFLSAHWRTGPGGAFRMGLGHGLYCLGCCWAVMLLLFVGGVMNLLWIAALAVLVLAEKVLPRGPFIARASGAAMLVAGSWLILT